MSLPKEPRQLMINLMYLVLTALLAMNVSSEILNAFKIVDSSINESSKNIANRSAATIVNFELALEDKKILQDPVKLKKVQTCKAFAEEAIKLRSELESQILVYKQMIIDRAGGIDPNTNDILRRDDLDASTAVMIEYDKKGPEMLAKLKKFKTDIAALVPVGADNFERTAKNDSVEKKLPLNFDVLPSEENKDNDWSYGNFHMVPAAGAITIIDKYINDIKNSESIVMDELWAKAFGERRRQEQVFTAYDVLVSPSSSYLLPGEKYTANIMLGAYNNKASNLVINVNGRSLPIVNGVATYTAIASGKGEQTINVSATYTDPNDNTNKSVPSKPFKYYIGEAQATISLDKMNVFYIGVDNPITFSASGVPAGSLSYSADNCTLTRAEGVNKYMVTVANGTAGKKATIKLSGKLGDGSTKDFGSFEYRIKNIPDPYPLIANKRGGNVAASELRVQEAVFAKLDNFDFEAKFTVVSFDVTYQKKRSTDLDVASSSTQYLTGPNANARVRDLVEGVKLGDRIYFENIKAVGPDKRIRSIGSVNFIINQ
jgi:gliding motility-associated protein GldM